MGALPSVNNIDLFTSILDFLWPIEIYLWNLYGNRFTWVQLIRNRQSLFIIDPRCIFKKNKYYIFIFIKQYCNFPKQLNLLLNVTSCDHVAKESNVRELLCETAVCLVCCVTRCSRWPCCTSRREGLSGPHCCPRTQTAAPGTYPDLKHTNRQRRQNCPSGSHHMRSSQTSYRLAGSWVGWRPWKAGWVGGGSTAAAARGSTGCGLQSDSAGRHSCAGGLGDTRAGSWTHLASPILAGHWPLEVQHRHTTENASVCERISKDKEESLWLISRLIDWLGDFNDVITELH